MANSRIPGPLGTTPSQQSDWDAPHQLGPDDQITSLVSHAFRDTPGPLGFMDWGDPSLRTSCKSETFMDGSVSRLITIVQLKKIFPRADDDKLSNLANELNVDPIKCGLDSCFQKAHFFAQIREESGIAMEVTSEKLSYSPERLKKVFSYYAERADEAALDGYLKGGNSKDGKKTPSQHAKAELIANNVYADRNGNGDSKSGDGWKYRGRGLIQITGRGNYAACAKKYRVLYPGSVENFEKNPELLDQFIFAVRSAICYWILHNLHKMADGSSDAKIDRITAIINKKTDSYSKRREHFKVAYDAFK